MKTCTICQRGKTTYCFNRNKTKADGLSNVCRDCNKEYHRRHYQANKAVYIAKQLERRQEMQRWFAGIKSDKHCEQCGENHPAVLDFHHDGKKDFDISEAVHLAYSKKRILAEIKRCRVLCSNCHRKLHAAIG